jgi:hypothetical protein
VVFVGDLVARGPDSRGAIRIVRELGAECVLGNHEQKLLDARRRAETSQSPPRLSASHRQLLDELTEQDWHWMASLPAWLELPDIEVAVVHAGIVPGVALCDQDAWVLTHVRTILPDGSPSADRSGTPWARLYQSRPHLVFGHDALSGLQLHPHATGLDTGCVYGGKLSALVLTEGQSPPRPEERRAHMISVPARRRYYEIGADWSFSR